jgi:hypothetical protein
LLPEEKEKIATTKIDMNFSERDQKTGTLIAILEEKE